MRIESKATWAPRTAAGSRARSSLQGFRQTLCFAVQGCARDPSGPARGDIARTRDCRPWPRPSILSRRTAPLQRPLPSPRPWLRGGALKIRRRSPGAVHPSPPGAGRGISNRGIGGGSVPVLAAASLAVLGVLGMFNGSFLGAPLVRGPRILLRIPARSHACTHAD